MVPRIRTASTAETSGDFLVPAMISARKAALTSAAGSTPGETRSLSRVSRNASFPAGGLTSNSQRPIVCSGVNGSAGMPCAALSFSCARYA